MIGIVLGCYIGVLVQRKLKKEMFVNRNPRKYKCNKS